jgi:hypothetical protein
VCGPARRGAHARAAGAVRERAADGRVRRAAGLCRASVRPAPSPRGDAATVAHRGGRRASELRARVPAEYDVNVACASRCGFRWLCSLCLFVLRVCCGGPTEQGQADTQCVAGRGAVCGTAHIPAVCGDESGVSGEWTCAVPIQVFQLNSVTPLHLAALGSLGAFAVLGSFTGSAAGIAFTAARNSPDGRKLSA